MPVNPERGLSDVNIHTHSGNCQEELSGTYAEYIESNRDALIAKCDRVNDCIKGLLEDENILVLLKGDNLSLNRTCGLIYDNNLEEDANLGKCKLEDREDIRDDLEQHLILQFGDVKASGWKNVRKCLTNNYRDKERTSFVNDICRLAHKKPQICDNRNIHKNVTTFFNNQIQHLQCTCRNLQKSDDSKGGISKSLLVGGLVGILLLMIVIFAVIFIFYRRRRKNRKSKKRAPNVIYLPAPNSDSCPVYQELGDDQNYPGYGKYPSCNPPTLPMRYSKQTTGQEDENAYLEPVEAGFRLRPKSPFPGKSNPHYGAPPEYSELDADTKIGIADKENGYFEPLPYPPENKPDSETTSGYETIAAVLSEEDIVPSPGDNPQPPVPAKRNRSDREETSRYVVLEKNEGIKRLDSTV